VPLAPVTVTA
jgi:hypothetical protein